MDKFKEYWKKHKKDIFLYLFMVIMCYIAMSNLPVAKQEDVQEISYTEFLELLDNGDIDTVYYNTSEEYMTITLFNDITREMPKKDRDDYIYSAAEKRIVLYPGYDEFRKDVLMTDTNIRAVANRITFMSVLSMLISFAFPLFLIVMLMKTMNMQGRGIDKKTLLQTSDVKFSDIIGHEEILGDVKFITELIKDPSKGDKIGAKVPKGLLLCGDPGTGKTLIAKAIAGEAGVPFLYQNASSFIEMFVGLGAKRVRELFKIAKQSAPCIIFIDEIDAIGCNRDSNKGTSENEQTINALLQEMDGFSNRKGIFIIAATNRADALDPALVRSGRFDRQIVVAPPRDWHVRKELFKHYLSGFTVSDDVDIDGLSKQVSGFTGADIAMICNEASIVAVMRDKDAIDTDCIEEAIDKKVFKGNRSKRESHIKDRMIIAYHESGHAVMSWCLGDPIARASIQSTVSGVGGVVFNQDRENILMTEKDMYNRILIAYAGHASEEIKFKVATTGASNDITQATEVMLQYVEHLGFDKEFGLLDVSILNREHIIGGNSTVEKLSDMSKKAYAECKSILEKHYDKVERLAQKLLDVETLSGEEIDKLMNEEI